MRYCAVLLLMLSIFIVLMFMEASHPHPGGVPPLILGWVCAVIVGALFTDMLRNMGQWRKR